MSPIKQCLSTEFFKKILFILERREKDKETSCVVASHTPPTGDQACHPAVCTRWGMEPLTLSLFHRAALNPLSHTSQGSLQNFKNRRFSFVSEESNGDLPAGREMAYINSKKASKPRDSRISEVS